MFNSGSSAGLLAPVLHLRVIVPEDMRDQVLGVLRREVGVAHILIYPGASIDPVGDEICADIARECANSLIKELKQLDAQHRGAITLTNDNTLRLRGCIVAPLCKTQTWTRVQ